MRLTHSLFIPFPQTKGFVKSASNGGAFEIELFGKRFPATASLAAPFDPRGKRVQGIY